MPSSKRSSRPRDWTCISCTGRWILYHWATWEALQAIVGNYEKLCGALPLSRGPSGLLPGVPHPRHTHTEGPENWGPATSTGTEGEKGFPHHPLCRPRGHLGRSPVRPTILWIPGPAPSETRGAAFGGCPGRPLSPLRKCKLHQLRVFVVFRTGPGVE